jgi:DNA-binding NarL/FixJ family response regulator
MAIRVFHCDDSAAFTGLVRYWLDDHDGIEWTGAEHDVARVGDAVAAARPHVVLLDTMGAPGDTALLDAVRERLPAAGIVVYSGYVSLMGRDGLPDGADAYVDKAEDDVALVAAIRGVAAARGLA